MWYALNEMIGKVLLVGVLGGGAIYGGYKFISGPPLLKQNADKSPNRWQRQATRQFERHMSDLQEDQSRRFKAQTEFGRRFGS